MQLKRQSSSLKAAKHTILYQQNVLKICANGSLQADCLNMGKRTNTSELKGKRDNFHTQERG